MPWGVDRARRSRCRGEYAGGGVARLSSTPLTTGASSTGPPYAAPPATHGGDGGVMAAGMLIEDVDPPLRAIIEEHGSFQRGEAIAVGCSDRDIRRLVRSGEWVRVRHGAYTVRDQWDLADGAARHKIRVRAALRTIGPVVAASHHSACAIHGLPLWGADLDVVHLTRLDAGAGRREGDVWHHEGFAPPEDLVGVENIVATRPVRAVLESAMLLTLEQGVALVDAGLHAGLYDKAALETQQQLMQSWPAAQRLQLVTRLADVSESVGESRSRYFFWAFGLPAPVPQFEVHDRDGQLVARVDFAWPDLGVILEFDGLVKYSGRLRPGESPVDAVVREKRREDAIRRATGWKVVRITWDDLQHPDRLCRMLRAELGL